ncbi:MAG: 2-oxoacid:acceptor oxidoreductase subunit alpha [Firmicutes bacterium]|nr:2-oxoacid:acceptor oxidoreductase subunit alpha [Bacillota bacterium]
MERRKGVKFLQGNEACAEGAFAAGARFYAGYPITPSSEIAEMAAYHLPKLGGTFLQMEDEISSIAAVIGASLAGVKSFTATSGPGFSLMQENLGVAILSEVPCVIIHVMRSGPSTGLATRPAQADIMQARWGTHGDHAIIALAAASVQECFELTVTAFNFAERFRTPVILLSDEIVGHMRESVVLPDPAELKIINRKSPTGDPAQYRPFAPDDDLIPPMSAFGSEYIGHANSSMRDETGFPNNTPANAERVIRRLYDKIYRHRHEIILTREFYLDDAEIGLVAFGATSRAAREAVMRARREGIKAGLLQLKTIWPFPDEAVSHLLTQARTVIVPEMNLGQLVLEVQRVNKLDRPVHSLTRVDGQLLNANQILAKIREVK